jgi:hypothetical protein
MENRSSSQAPDAVRYEIRLRGHLGARWAGRFDGMTLTPHDDGTTLLVGLVPDQAALHGLLRTVRDLGLPLISLVQRADEQTAPRATSDPANRPTRQGD